MISFKSRDSIVAQTAEGGGWYVEVLQHLEKFAICEPHLCIHSQMAWGNATLRQRRSTWGRSLWHIRDWDKKLPLLLLAYRITIHEITGMTPASMGFIRREWRRPSDWLRDISHYVLSRYLSLSLSHTQKHKQKQTNTHTHTHTHTQSTCTHLAWGIMMMMIGFMKID
jgi:hypothetical protein